MSNRFYMVAQVAALVLSMTASAVAEESLVSSLPCFRDVTASSGIDFVHINGELSPKNYIPETKGGGAGFLDYDGDGWLDLFLVQGSTMERLRENRNPRSQLWRNLGDGRFENVTESALPESSGWAMGISVGDFDNNGFPDIYLTCFGPNMLFRNNGDGTFTDVTDRAGVGDPRWSTSSAFGDYDSDGDLDLYVANYVFINTDALPARACRHREAIVLCGPMGLPGESDVLYRNEGDGTFTDVTETSGAADRKRYYGLGVVWADFDNDRDLDLYVANDATPNLLFVNQGEGRFEEMGLISGAAVNAEGREQASMGVDAADYDNDGRLDVYLTHFSDDYSTLLRNDGGLSFRDVTAQSRILQSEIGLVSWGTKLVDFNNDGWKDILHSNGHVYPYLIEAGLDETFEQPATFYANRGDGTFLNASSLVGPDFQNPRCSRGVAFGDFDNDGDFDFLFVNINSSPTLFRTDRRDSNNWIMVRTVGRVSNRDGLGGRIEIDAAGSRQTWEIKRGGSIYSASDPRAHFGLGKATKIDLMRVQWPSGKIQEFQDLPVNQQAIVDEIDGLKWGN